MEALPPTKARFKKSPTQTFLPKNFSYLPKISVNLEEISVISKFV